MDTELVSTKCQSLIKDRKTNQMRQCNNLKFNTDFCRQHDPNSEPVARLSIERQCIKMIKKKGEDVRCGLSKYQDNLYCLKHINQTYDKNNLNPTKCIAPTLKRGLTDDSQKQQCAHDRLDGKRVCQSHLDIETYTSEEFDNMRLCENYSCNRYFFSNTLNKCQTCYKPICQAILKGGGHCEFQICKDSESQRFCKVHSKKYEIFSDQQILDMPICKGDCGLKFVPKNSNQEKCDGCIINSQTRRENIKTSILEHKIVCAYEFCSSDTKNNTNEFCGKHQHPKYQKTFMTQKAKEANKRLCINFDNENIICRNMINLFSNDNSCHDCLQNLNRTINVDVDLEISPNIVEQIELDHKPRFRHNVQLCMGFKVKTVTTYKKDIRFKQPGTVIYNTCKREAQSDLGYCKFHHYLSNFKPETRPLLKYCAHGPHMFMPDYSQDKITKVCKDCKFFCEKKNAKQKIARNDQPKCKYVDPNRGRHCQFRQKNGDFCLVHKIFVGYDLNSLCQNYVNECFNEKMTDCNYCSDCKAKETRDIVLTKEQCNLLGINDKAELKNKTLVCKQCHFIGKIVYFLDRNRQISPRCDVCRFKNDLFFNNRISRKERYDVRDAITDIRRRAKKINIPIELTDNEIIRLITSCCHYCGESNPEGFNGIDRINNNKLVGYKTFNCVSCCWTCNRMKGRLFNTISEFINACKNIQEKFGSINKYMSGECQLYYKKFKDFVDHNQNDRYLKVGITENEYFKILSLKCFYCDCTNSNQLNIDRKENIIHYIQNNCLSCCTICNMMKNELHFDYFKLHIDKILNHQKIHENFKPINKIPENITTEKIKENLRKLIEYIKTGYDLTDRDIYIDNRGSGYRQLQSDTFYEKLVYNNLNLNNFEPELEFCETKEQKDIWTYFRLKMSSIRQSTLVGKLVQILIRDKISKLYIGITSLSNDIMIMPVRDYYIGWTKEQKLQGLNTILNISTCVGLRPFCFNFNGGKLMAKLMFSKEVYDYIRSKYPKDQLVGLITTSLYGKSVQYSRLSELKFLGYTSGYGIIHIPEIYLNYIDQYIDEQKIQLSDTQRQSRLYRVNMISKKLGFGDDLIRHGIERGVYFGYLAENGHQYLTSQTEKLLMKNLETVKNISDSWKARWAVQRFDHLVSTNRLLTKIEFNPKCILSDKDLAKKNRVQRNNAKGQYQKHNNEKSSAVISLIIKLKKEKPTISCLEMSKLISKQLGEPIIHQRISDYLKKYDLSFYSG